ncbi:hypothetical protein [Methylosinus sp. Sm6]|uniref:hypothetical protein n=1 Tax=Methylosinus sp. Sm6 TaxID=2866948 RepID=UPI001C99DF6B|nr:hypothetical protein [Methylosinus sp. Sm6]MBY6242556.1 hypothetical protein [Methylosinus sp. Sm6]
MIDLGDRLARLLFETFGSAARPWDELPPAERDRYFRTAQDVLREVAASAPFDAETLVERVRETRPTRLGFLYMTYALNRTEAAALLAARAGLPRRQRKPAA